MLCYRVPLLSTAHFMSARAVQGQPISPIRTSCATTYRISILMVYRLFLDIDCDISPASRISQCGHHYESCHLIDTTYPSAYVINHLAKTRLTNSFSYEFRFYLMHLYYEINATRNTTTFHGLSCRRCAGHLSCCNRPEAIRTLILQFWRLLFCQLNYRPMCGLYAIAYHFYFRRAVTASATCYPGATRTHRNDRI